MATRSRHKSALGRFLGFAHLLFSKQPEGTLQISIISAISCLYTTWRLAGLECERASTHLRHGRLRQSLASFERACILVMLTDTLVDIASRHSSHGPLAATRRRMLAVIERWLEEARRELPRAADCLRNLAADDKELSAMIMRSESLISRTN